jgi:hypothetical protein
MTAMTTVLIDETYPQAMPLVNYLKSLPFTQVEVRQPAPPCQYSIEQVHEKIDCAMEDIRAGRFFTTEEVFKPYEKWL